MERFKIITVVTVFWSLCAAIAFAEPQTTNKEPNQPAPIDVRDIKDANLSPYLAYLKQYAKSPIEYVLDKFKEHNVVMLGEMHGIRENLEFVRDLIEPLYHKAGVRYFAMETLKSKNITLANQLVTSKEYDQQLALRIFRDYGWPTWGYKEYMDIIKAIWELNSKLPSQAKRFKVIPLSSDWDAYDLVSGSWSNADEHTHEQHMANVLAREVLDKGEKAIVLIGYHHTFTRYRQPLVKDGKLVGERPPRFGHMLYKKYGDQIFPICLHLKHAGPELATKQPSSTHPVFIDFLERIFKLNDNQPVGFDTEKSPFADLRDRGSYYFVFQTKVVFSDIGPLPPVPPKKMANFTGFFYTKISFLVVI